jgi:two-component system, OmpR family, response regulator
VTRVLIVDDHYSFSEMLELVLRPALADKTGTPRRSPRFVYATSVAEGLRLVSEDTPFDLAVVDLILPDGDGTKVVREIKAQSPGTPVVVLSASEHLSEALAAGADEAISKRTRLAEIVASLAPLLGIMDQSGSQDT